jgi:hypothetical protein
LKDCIFDCEDDKQAEIFDLNIKKLSVYAATTYNMGAIMMTMVDERINPEIKKPDPYTGNDRMETKIYELKISQYITNKKNLRMNARNCTPYFLGNA